MMQSLKTDHAVPSSAQPQEAKSGTPEGMPDVEQLTQKLDVLLQNYKSLLESDETDAHVKALKNLTDAYRNGLFAAELLTLKGHDWIEDVRSRTKLAAEELQRLEDEGGPPPATREQEAHKTALMKAAKKTDQIAPILHQQFGPKEEGENAPASSDQQVSNT